jgi:hypothetical protein
MLRRVALVKTDVSEESITYIIRVERICELGTTLGVTSDWSISSQHASVVSTANVRSSLIFFALMMEEVCSSKKNRFSQEPHGVKSQKMAFFMVNLTVGFPIWRSPHICVNIAMCEHFTFDCEIFRCGRIDFYNSIINTNFV